MHLRATDLEKPAPEPNMTDADKQRPGCLKHTLICLAFIERTNSNYRSVFEEHPLGLPGQRT